ncbi:putative nitroreductase hbn1 [Acrodontium crateriforme]|uniref:Nitroreductase hbn1 n=1 Tax=Acrodontium crateriforme TaxID=150365 RepID=A0AAQ3R625_9PEZI|nr:putative nitroreductase hbn1 [Acrodontium crateriforme]
MSLTTIPFNEAVTGRRTVYALNKKCPVDNKRIKEIVEAAVTHVPSAFNSQSARLVVLLKDDHEKFWDFVSEALKAIVPPAVFESSNARILGFKAAYGSVRNGSIGKPTIHIDIRLTKSQILFYEDREVISGLQAKMPQYAEKFPQWSEHTSAMHQFALWTAIEAEGAGANLQHYNPLPDEKAAAHWNLPKTWDLKAQLVFGGREADWESKLLNKTFEPLDKRAIFHGL